MSHLPHHRRHAGPSASLARQPSALSRTLDRILPAVVAQQQPSPEGLQERRASVPAGARGAALQPSSWDADDRTIDVVWTTGARGVRFDWDSLDMVDEELATGATNVRLDRLNRGAPVLNTHQSSDLFSQIGTVVPGTARMEGGRGVATIQLSARDDLAPIIADIAAGIIRNISVGYRTHAFEVDMKAKPRPLYRAVDWEPFEISFVPVPFDAGAQVRHLADEPTSCIIRNIAPKEPRMSISDLVSRFGRRAAPAPTPSPSPTLAPAPVDGVRELSYGQPASINWLRSYAETACEGPHSGFDRHEASEIALEFAERGLSEASARDAMVQIVAERQRTAMRHAPSGFGRGDATFDNPSFRADAIQDALFARMSGNAPTDAAREFMGMSMVHMAGDMLSRSGTRDVHRMNASDILNAAAWNSGGGRRNYATDRSYSRDGGTHTTSDFPELLMGAGERFLLEQFAAAASPLKQIGRRRTARDFRAISGLQLSGFGTLLKVPENGEIKHGTFTERKETYKLETFAKQFGLSRQAIINDDLGAFSDPIRIMARAASETEAQLLAGLINSNPALSDNVPLFHATHGNLAAGNMASGDPMNGVPNIERLSEGRKAMRNQKDADGVTPLAAAPVYIVAGTDNETRVEQLLSDTQAYLAGDVNPFAGKLTAAIDPRLDPAPWYLFGAPGSVPVLEYAYLDDQPGPRIEMKEGWDTLGTEFRVFEDFGAGLVDHRGGYKNAGK